MEIWKDIPEYEGMYQISNLGRLKSYPRWQESKWSLSGLGKKIWLNEKILKTHLRNGYVLSRLCKDAVVRKFTLHRLVASAFIPNPENKPCINHKDGNKQNNTVENLEWVTYTENSIHAFRIGLTKQPNYKKMINIGIREAIKISGNSYKEIATEFNVSLISVYRIKRNYSVKIN